ncbi:hypothetical protein E4631_24010 [Hymenobacter sp. UV11]|uniref:hypothetical protein n=1 Tax=Hymenobacter sp. UV11 TaxID=1849735 RepID=UPI00105FDBAD|nr:hypothetical protein [Hymenobacter sp. UV11]TDN38616.1 hypothetical protein A8B98_22995 [Hymenobacter sp. UV11]TFZ62996.1 hypothetical protein E4631_24010 [Hymenobacter sp. UV11]
MAIYTAKYGQTLLDVALQLTGSLDGLVELAALNQLAVDVALPVGCVVSYDQARQQASAVARQLALTDGFVVTDGELLEPVPAPTPSFTRQPFPQDIPASTDYAIKPNQSVLDLALQLYGSLDNLVELCQLNGFTLSQEVPLGTRLTFDKTRQTESATASYMALISRPVTTWIAPPGAGPAEFEPAEYEPAEYD